MGNVELCGGPNAQDANELHLVGHIKNSQTRALISVLEASKIKYKLDIVSLPQPSTKKSNQTQGVQGLSG